MPRDKDDLTKEEVSSPPEPPESDHSAAESDSDIEPDINKTDQASPTDNNSVEADEDKSASKTESSLKAAVAKNRREELRKAQEAAAAKRRRTRIVVIAVIVVVALVATIGIVLGAVLLNKKISTGKPPHTNTSKNALTVADSKGRPGLKVVALYTDFQCPFCAKFEKAYGQELIRLADKGEIRLELHTMSFLDENIKGNHSSRSAQAAACADKIDKYPEYFKTVFDNQPEEEGTGFTDQQLREDFTAKAGIKGADLKTLQQCYDSKEMQGFVSEATKSNVSTLTTLASEQGLRRWGTPLLTVNGKYADLEPLAQNGKAFDAPVEKLKALIDSTG